MNCGFRLGARSEVGRRGSEGIRHIRRGPLRRSLRPPPADFAGDRPRESIVKRVFGCWQKIFWKKFVIGCYRVHTFTRLNLLLEPKRILQRFGFVFLGALPFAALATKDWRNSRGFVFSHKDQERQERRKDMYEGAFLSPPRKKIKFFLSSLSRPCI